MFTKKRIILALVLMLMSILLAQGVRSYFYGKAATTEAQPAHNKAGDRHHPVFVGGLDAAGNPLLSDNALVGGNFIALDDHSGFFIPGPGSNAGHAPAGNGMSDTDKPNGAAEPGTGNAQPGPAAGSGLPRGDNAPARSVGGGNGIPQSGGNPGAHTDPGVGPTPPGGQPQPEHTADNPHLAGNPPPGPGMPPNDPSAILPPDSRGAVVPLTTQADRATPTPVPEPASLALIAAGLLGMAWLRKKT